MTIEDILNEMAKDTPEMKEKERLIDTVLDKPVELLMESGSEYHGKITKIDHEDKLILMEGVPCDSCDKENVICGIRQICEIRIIPQKD